MLIGLALVSDNAATIIGQSFADAYLQVTVFVAATFFIFYFLEAWFNFDVKKYLQHHKNWQVPIAASLGALPGCGGAIMVMTQYLRGGLGFSSVVAVLTATMGDAAFLLLARAPAEGAIIFAAGWLVGIISGYMVDAIHGSTFFATDVKANRGKSIHIDRQIDSKILKILWAIPLIPGFFVGFALAFQSDTKIFGQILGIDTLLWLGILGSGVTLSIWVILSLKRSHTVLLDDKKHLTRISFERNARIRHSFERVMGDTIFVSIWVIMAYLLYELGVHFLNIELDYLFNAGAIFIPLIAILVGFIPGCGPQVVIATMYLGGSIPFSAEIGNAISNDGDALFPAIALNPKVAIVATLYSAVPALIVAYSVYWLFE